MFFVCAHCENEFNSVQSFSNHYRMFHSEIKRFTCANNKCQRVFSNIRKHILHIIRDNCITRPQNNQEQDSLYQNEEILFQAEISSINLESGTKENIDFFRDIMKIIIKTISDDRMPRSVALKIFRDTFDIYNKHIKFMLNLFPINVINQCQEIFSIFNSVFASNNYTSEYMILKQLKNMNILINFQNIKLGSQSSLVYCNSNVITTKKFDFSLQIVDLRSLFTALFSQTPLLDQIIEFIKIYEKPNSIISNILQTPLWQKKKKQFNPKNLQNILLIPMLIYFDDFEYLNPLGSHSCIQKLGAVYLKILSLPDYISSKLSHIFLAMLFFTEDRKQFGNSAVFKPLIEQLNSMQNEGIMLIDKGYSIVKLIPCIVVGDNLGVNSVLGFSESFNSLYFCRFCNCNKNETKYMVKENMDKLRSRESYKENLDIGNPRMTGINENSIWNSLTNFHVTENFSVDCMHDILEGVAHYDLFVIFQYCVTKNKYFSIELLNRRIEMFNFGPFIKQPPLFNTDCLTKNKFKFSSSEMKVIITFLPILVGDLVKSSKEWDLLICLRELLLIVFRKNYHVASLKYLENLIETHNNLYLDLSKSHLKPKFHFLLHYTRVLKNIGPIVLINSMRFEAKHQPFKKVGYNSCNRINILKTLHIKNQFQIANTILNYKDLYHSPVYYAKPNKSLDPEKLIELKSLGILEEDYLEKDISEILWVNFHGTLLKKETIICTGSNNKDEPIFALIFAIFIVKDKIFLGLKQIETLFFNKHFFAFEVEVNDIKMLKELNCLICNHISYVCKNAENKKLVIWDF